ncbi:MAG: ribosome-associated translation inhibitor RaiA [Thermomicrobiales bacterium]|nr:ribosome-associated translation inhibitor RaiA [Thermomicrobiales bacterium]
MDIQVRGNGVAVSDDLQKFITKRSGHLDRVVEKVDDAKLELRAVRKRVGPSTVVAQITIRSGRDVLRAEEEAADANVAIDKAFAKLERQIHRVRDKRSRRRTAGQPTIREAAPAGVPGTEPEVALAPDEESDVGDLVRTKRFGVKPMDVEEAIEQMELLGHDFFLFHYADEDIPSVVYRRRDGAYGLLIPRE